VKITPAPLARTLVGNCSNQNILFPVKAETQNILVIHINMSYVVYPTK